MNQSTHGIDTQHEHRAKPAAYVRIVLVSVAGILVLIALFEFTGLKEREIFSYPLPNALDSLFQTDTVGVQLTEEPPDSGSTVLQSRYEEVLAKLQNIQHSPEAGRMGEFGQQRIVEHVSTSVILAQQSFAEGDAGNALRLLETAYSGWQTAMEDLAQIPVAVYEESGQVMEPDKNRPSPDDFDPPETVYEVTALPKDGRSPQTGTDRSAALENNPAADPTGENPIPAASFTGQEEITESDDKESTIENPMQADTGQKTAGLPDAGGSVESEAGQPALGGQNHDWTPSGEGQDVLSNMDDSDGSSSGPADEESDSAPFTQSKKTVQNSAVSSSRFTQRLTELDGLLAALRIGHSNQSDYNKIFGHILERRKKSVEAHSENDLSEAMRLIELALNETYIIVQKEEEAFQLSMSVARKAYQSGDVARAESAIASAERLRPDLDEVLYWKEHIRQLPLLIQAQHDANNARNAGQLQDEKDALMRILALTPGNSVAAKRVDEITLQMNDRKFKRLIGRGYKAIENSDSAEAGSALSEAGKLRPSSAELPKLRRKIADLERRQAIALHLEVARHGSAQDNWIQALRGYGKILAMDSTHPEANQGRDFATAILAAQQGLDDFLAHPDRLSSPNIATAARAAVEEARVLGSFSNRLRTAVDTLEASVMKWQTPVPVRILSDNETDIRIRGVGKVGKTTERIIEILPGKYLFEGKRENYRSVLMEVHVDIDQTALTEVTVICHESG